MSALGHIRGMPGLLRQLRSYPRFLFEQNEKLVRKHARALISSSGKNKGLVQIVPPASMDRKVFGKAAKKQGEAKVMADIWKVYGTPSDVYKLIKAKNPSVAAGYWQAVKRKDWAGANGIARRFGLPVLQDFTSDDGAEHKQRRRNGQVTGKQKTLYVTDARYVRAYIEMKKHNVGLLAAALVNSYGGEDGVLAGVPAWVSRHASSWASAQIKHLNLGDAFLVRISLDGRALNSMLQRFFTEAQMMRLYIMQREAPHALRAAAKAAGLLK